MKNILVPNDFSQYADNALKIAFQIARKTEGFVHILHIVSDIHTTLLAPDDTQVETTLEEKYLRQAEKNAETHFHKLIDYEQFPAEKVKIHTVLGNVFKTIMAQVEALQIELIVMGTHGTSAIEDFFVGSNTEKVVRYAECPVLAVKDKPANFIMANILFPTNFSDKQLPAFAELRVLQTLFEGHIHLLFVDNLLRNLSDEDVEEEKEAFAKKAQLDNYTFHLVSAPSEEVGILETAQKIGADLIVITTSQRKGLAHFFVGSVAEDVVNHAPIPVLTLKMKG